MQNVLLSEVIHQVCPFYLALDEELRITEYGPSIGRLVPDLQIGDSFHLHFVLLGRPKPQNLTALRRYADIAIVLAHHAGELRLRGQVLFPKGASGALFLGAPAISSIEQLQTMRISLADFPLHDGSRDHLVALQVMRSALSDASEMASALMAEKTRIESENADKTQFLATISHEIRTPMNGVLGLASLLVATDGLNDRQRSLANKIVSSSEALLGVLNDILDHSKLQAGKMRLVATKFSIQSVLDASLSLFAPTAQNKGIHLEGRFEGDSSVRVVGDAGRIRQILMNLISNAIKFTQEGSIRVTVRQAVQDQRVQLYLEVRDSGTGISEAEIGQLFKDYQQVGLPTSGAQAGTGLGLAICKRLAELMDGEIGVSSRIGSGSQFWVRLQLPLAAPEEEIGYGDQLAMRPLEAPCHALIVEDNEVNQLVFQGMLDLIHCRADIATNGLDAIGMVRENDYDFVLMDVSMPIMDGETATKKIREFSSVPIIGITANCFEEQIRAYLAAGMNACLAKPLQRQALERQLAALNLAGLSLK